MLIVVQRVSEAAVRVDGEELGAIGRGLLALTCGVAGDSDEDVDWLTDKLVDLRLFADDAGRTQLSVAEVGGAVLVVPQFTLAADWRKGRRPSFSRAAPPDEARRLVARVVARLEARGVPVAEGRFGALMDVRLHNDGPFTLVLDSAERPGRRP